MGRWADPADMLWQLHLGKDAEPADRFNRDVEEPGVVPRVLGQPCVVVSLSLGVEVVHRLVAPVA